MTSPVPTVPALLVPFISEETQILHFVECDHPMQPLPARPEKHVAADLSHFSRLPLHLPHSHPQASRQKR